jgi:membrane fusion protein (multidrug efflux system)
MQFPFPLRPLLFAGAIGLLLTACQDKQPTAGGERPPTEVVVVTLAPQPISLTTELPGRAVAYRKAEVRPQVSGLLQRRLFEEGTTVEAGQQLYQIDAERYEAAAQTAKANLAKSKANATSAQAREKRYQNLLGQKAISQQDYDDALATSRQAAADVAVSEAAVITAEIDLNYTRVVAPISGRIGKSNVTEGALVSAQQAGVLATIHQLDPIYVDLAQPAARILDLRRQIMSGKVARGDSAPVRITLEDGTVYPHEGELQFTEMNVNESTGTVVVRALFPNPDQLLLPGMFVRAEIQEGVRDQALLVPQRGVTRDREGNATAMVVNGENQVEVRTLVASRAVGNQWLVEKGLEAGDRVIIEGLQKVAPGAPVSPVELKAVSQAGHAGVSGD